MICECSVCVSAVQGKVRTVSSTVSDFCRVLKKIVIDPERCPNVTREFSEYELERDTDGEFKSVYPDKNNHTIDAVRYALEDEITKKKARVIKRSELDL